VYLAIGCGLRGPYNWRETTPRGNNAMKKRIYTATCLLATALLASTAHARDDAMKFPLSDALNTADAKDKLGGDVRFYFGDQKHAAVSKSYGTVSTSRKTNGVGKSDQAACEWAFLSAMIALRDRALKEGGNAVINISSNYKNNEFKSATEYECGAGNIMVGVSFKGEVVKLAN
jgi:hypothetical protein